MFDKIILRLPSPLLHHGRNHGDSSTDASSCWGSCSGAATRHGTLNCCIWFTPWHAHRAAALRNPHPIHELAQYLLVLLRSPVSHPNPSLPLHARLSQHKPWWPELLQYAIQHCQNDLQAPSPRPSVSCRFPGLLNIHQLLDDPNISPFITTIFLQIGNDRPLRAHWHRGYGLWSFLLESYH